MRVRSEWMKAVMLAMVLGIAGMASAQVQVTVPDVVGLTQAAATTAIEGANLTVGTVTQVCSDTVPAGNVISQNPVGGASVAPGSTVDFVVSTGPCVTVPNVVGLTQAVATTAIGGANLTVGTVTQVCSDTVAAGNVISQNPVGGASVAPGSTVDFVVSTGPCVTVPNVVGLTEAVATAMIKAAKLYVATVTPQCSDTVAAGNVISQDPVRGASVAPDTAVNLVVSTGPCVTVPNVVGLTQAAATTAIGGANLTVGTVTRVCSDTVPAGNVISQNPVRGASVAPGSTVDFVVSTGPCPVTVPDVVGLAQAAAEAAITAANLYVGTVTQVCSDTVPAGSVISQNPPAGVIMSSGGTVALEISSGPCPAQTVAVPNVAG
ncbi:MAG TPA: PASTA domain-containing protein, partial [Candidatus Hydrogenedentes bacterium]|nr:PASTA domain-containing protein [Candidatus Hydrogenedentota bacterium]